MDYYEGRFDMGSEITEINKETFWQLIEEVKKQCGQDMNASISWIKKELLGMPPEQSLQFHAIMHGYRDAADKYGLWTAATLIKEYGCSDDGFIDFRAWLIAQGKDVYMAALENPDSLAGIEKYGDCAFESLSYVGDEIYEELTGRSAYRDCTLEMEEKMLDEVSGDIKYHPLIDYPLQVPDAIAVYPQIGAAFRKKYDIDYFSRHSLWNTSLPELKELLEKGKDEVEKFRERKEKNKDNPKKRNEPSRS